ncbi:hypothetical protein X943_003037 [Babesia divergens]|uniref:Uncharacterized protein n=1 Tax=Babesia divergens TaxID=32595 RepID=A0AAD9GDE0_BABDI|nr:hypothetical protein X943_003037 [Babesia divergens]
MGAEEAVSDSTNLPVEGHSANATADEAQNDCCAENGETDVESKIRSRGLQLRGECLPKITDITMSYREAWRTGKQGCLGTRRNLWDPQLFSGTWYFTCDGTDPNNFLVLHSHKDSCNWEKITISMWDLLDGFWVANKYRVIYQTRAGECGSSSKKTMVIEGFTRAFYEAMIKCIHESQVRLQLMQLELKDLQEGFTNYGASPCKAVAPRFRRSLPGYCESQLAAMALNIHATAQNDTQTVADTEAK